MTELQSLGAIYWSKAWLESLRTAGLDDDMLGQGETYARHDWGLEAYIDKGKVEATAGSGRRLQYDVTITLPVLSDEVWDLLLERIATSSARTAALLDGVVEPALLEDARAVGAQLVAGPDQLSWECGCAEIVGAQQLCKHVAGTLYLLADSFDEDPFDLLLLRGRSRDELRAGIGERRSGSSSGPDLDEGAEAAWQRQPGALPMVPTAGDAPGELTAWATDPPANAPFSAAGLRVVGTETASRAWRRLKGMEPTSHLHLSVAADLARRADLAEGTPLWRDLVANTGLTSAELTSRARAWRVAGEAGVDVVLRSQRTVKVSPEAQMRQAERGSWFRFEKRSGRWTLVDGPVDDPNQLLSPDPIS